MKKLTIIICLLLAAFAVYSQIGVEAGFGLSSKRNSQSEKNSQKLGFHAGAFYDLHLWENLYLQPRLQMSYEPTKITNGFYSESRSYKGEFSETGWFITAPVALVYKFPLKNTHHILVGFGGYLSLGLWGNNKEKIWENDEVRTNTYPLFPNQRPRDGYGLEWGAGYEMDKYILNLRLKYGLSNTSYFQDKAMVYMLSFGYKL